jgi:hypothetical protein
LEVYFFDEFYINKKIDVKKIIQIGNNVGYFNGNFNLERNPTTGYFHEYKVTILLDNGKMLDIICFNLNEYNYYKSKDVATAIADTFNIPLILCDEYSYLKVNKKIVEGNRFNKTEKTLEMEKIPKYNPLKSFLLELLGLVTFTILFFSFFYLYSDFKTKLKKKKLKKNFINNSDFNKRSIKKEFK